jgi:hypothetical protein
MIGLFSEIAQKYGMPDGVIVDQVTEDSPIIASALFQPTSHGMTHKYAEVKSVTAMTAVNRNDTYPTVGADKKVDNKDLALYAGTQEVHVNTAAEWGTDGAGAAAYFNEQMPTIIRESLSDIESEIIYNDNAGFEVIAKAFGKLTTIAATDTTPNLYYSLYCVGWQQGNFSIIYNEQGFSGAGVVKQTPLNGGNRYKNSANKSVYGVDLELPIGLFGVNARNIGGIVNFTLATIDSTFFKKLNDMIALVRGGNKKLYAHPLVIARLMQAEESYTLSNGDNGVFKRMYSDIELVSSFSFLQGTEAFITI